MEVGDVLLHIAELLAQSVRRNAVEEGQPAGDQTALNFLWTLEIGQNTTLQHGRTATTSDGASTTKTSFYSNLCNRRYKFGYCTSTALSRRIGQSVLQMTPCPQFRSV